MKLPLSASLAAPFLAAAAFGQQPKAVLFQGGFAEPILVTAPAGDFDRVFVVEQGGKIKIVKQGSTLPIPYLDLGPAPGLDLVQYLGEQGLLGLAFHPSYATNGLFFVFYTNKSGNNVLARYAASASSPDVADPASGQVLMTLLHPTFGNHNGGCVRFGPDGFLYLGTGDGGGVNDPSNNAQNADSFFGKLLRIDPGVGVAGGYAIPPNNPFLGIAGLDEIYSVGLRNPWRFSFDLLAGDLYIADVGQSLREEIDFQPAAYAPTAGDPASVRNYGWRCFEGSAQSGVAGCAYPNPYPISKLVGPIYEYAHPTGYAVIGGHVYRGAEIPSLRGKYHFADYKTDKVWSFAFSGPPNPPVSDDTATLAPGTSPGLSLITSFGEDAAGELYVCTLFGDVFKLVPSAPVLNGVEPYGSGSAACWGEPVIGASSTPVLLNPAFKFTATHAPPSSLGVCIVTDAKSASGSDTWGLGVKVWIDLALATKVGVFNLYADAAGLATGAAPIPKTAALVGQVFYAQAFFVDGSCWPRYSATNALKITIQP